MLIGWCGTVCCDMDCRYCPLFDRDDYEDYEDYQEKIYEELNGLQSDIDFGNSKS